MTEQRVYNAPGLDLQTLGAALAQWFQEKGLESQVVHGTGGSLSVQARKEGGWDRFLSQDVALGVMMTPQGDNLLVQAGGAKWADKVAVGAISAIVFFPLLLLPAWGAYKQKELIDDTFQFLDNYIKLGVSTVSVPNVAPTAISTNKTEMRCPSCGQLTHENAQFCDHCGSKLTIDCAKCGVPLRDGAKFCDSCGTPVEPAQKS